MPMTCSARPPLAVAPRVEASIKLRDGRRIGFAEYGPPQGRPVLWFHGTPGARRQIPPTARSAAAERNVRIVALERPGVGASSPHSYDSVLDWADDVQQCVDHLGLERFGIVGLSGGGPYVLACAHELADRTVAAGVIGGVAPTRGDDAPDGGVVQLTARFSPAGDKEVFDSPGVKEISPTTCSGPRDASSGRPSPTCASSAATGASRPAT